MSQLKNVQFYLGNTLHTVKSEDVNAETTLNSYLRNNVHLTGTKRMCLEGGCGACIVAVEEVVDGKNSVFAINSCLVSILSCHGWKIHTIEGIGNSLIGYHQLQKLLAENNGSQCGFCSGGMVMNMYALHESGSLTMKEIENSFGGNLCRCTGYRPILTAFKKLASDAPKTITDIEELNICKNDNCTTPCQGQECSKKLINFCFQLSKSKWVKVNNLKDLLDVLKTSNTNNYMLVGGNTARGVYRQTPSTVLPELYIDITSVVELISVVVDTKTLTLGGNVSLTKAMNVFQDVAKNNKQFAYLKDMREHIDLVATVPVRNIGTLAGNLMIKHIHNEFPSDIFLLLETFNAVLVIVDTDKNEVRTSPQNFLQMDMTKKVLRSIELRAIDSSYRYATYKIMPRAQNAHAMVNAGFLLKMNNNNNVESARIVYGGINPKFIHASKTEGLIKSKNIFDNTALQLVLKSLYFEIQPNYILPDPTPQYRKNLAVALFYKFVLKIAVKSSVSSRYISGGTLLQRPVSSGVQKFGTQKETFPVSEPVIKLEALAQTSGQAQYIDDMPDLPNQLHAAFVTAQTMANSYIIGTDATVALKLPGVVAYYDKKDILGENNFMPKEMGSFTVQEELFCSGRVKYFDQPIGIIVANNPELAIKAAGLVNVTYSSPKNKPYLNIKEVLEANDQSRIHHQTDFVPKRKGTDVTKTIKGTFYIPWQYHFHMEVQCCNVVPTEDGINMFPATQWMDLSQMSAASVLNLPMNKVNVVVRRLGGAFGAKISRNAQISSAAALAAYKTKKPVKMWVDFETNMNCVGKRFPLYCDYEVDVNKSGVIQLLDAKLYSDFGVGGNEPVDSLLVQIFQNCYDVSTWGFSTYTVTTDTHANAWTRAPGTFEGLGCIETIMDHIAYSLKLDPIDVKMANTDTKKYPLILEFWKDMQSNDDIANRKQKIKEYNAANRWKKRGMSIIPMVWTLEVVGNFTVLVSIFHGDGTVVVSHAGVEMGQGINTKVAQVCAYKFGIPLDKVAIKPSICYISPNASTTGGSLTSEAVCYATIAACDILLERIKPVRDKMNNPTWAELINQCFAKNVHLSASGFASESSPGVAEYPIYGLCATEVEVDILTGQREILRVDIIEDVGNSMSPLIDIGQVEGAFVMGIGYYTTEEIIFNEEGKLLTNRTWTYKPPGAKDIPIDFRITFPKNIPNPVGVLQSKAIAEPPTCLSISVPLAIRHAIASARTDSDPNVDPWIPMDGPTTVEKAFLYSLNSYEQYKL